jgi:hypothetical protein
LAGTTSLSVRYSTPDTVDGFAEQQFLGFSVSAESTWRSVTNYQSQMRQTRWNRNQPTGVRSNVQ